MVSLARWQSAQQYERGYWESLASRIATGSVAQLDWYRWRAGELVRRLKGLGLGHLTDGHARVLEVGGGPAGVGGFFPPAERLALRPVEAYPAADSTLSPPRSPAA